MPSFIFSFHFPKCMVIFSNIFLINHLSRQLGKTINLLWFNLPLKGALLSHSFKILFFVYNASIKKYNKNVNLTNKVVYYTKYVRIQFHLKTTLLHKLGKWWNIVCINVNLTLTFYRIYKINWTKIFIKVEDITYQTWMPQLTTSVTRNLTCTFSIVNTTKMPKTFANVTFHFLKNANTHVNMSWVSFFKITKKIYKRILFTILYP